MDLIQEAKKRGYKKGTPIRYVPHAVDFVEGDYFELENGEVKAYAKPQNERKGFDDDRHDTLFDGENWVEIVDLSKRSPEQKKLMTCITFENLIKMTKQDLDKLEKGDEVFFAGSFYEVAEIQASNLGAMIGIYDEPPSKHIDYINPENIEGVRTKAYLFTVVLFSDSIPIDKLNSIKPPLGLMPREFHEKDVKIKRFNAVCGAIARYYTANLEINLDWVKEYNELIPFIKTIKK